MIEGSRRWMRDLGYERPVVAGGYNGPALFEFREEAFAALAPAMAGLMQQSANHPETDSRTAPC